MVRSLLVLAFALFAWATPAIAAPDGYTVEQDDAVRWTYPTGQDNVRDRLRTTLEAAWPTLQVDLGTQIVPDLDIRIARNPSQMRALAPEGHGVPTYASGVAYPDIGVVMMTLAAPSQGLTPDLDALLIHELSHVALHRAVKGNEVPRWFSEGLAIHQANAFRWPRMQALLRAAVGHRTIPLRELSRRFPKRLNDVDVAYAQSADLVNYLRKLEGTSGRFEQLIAALGRGLDFDTALGRSYGINLLGLERQWRDSLRTRYRIVPLLLGGSTVWSLTALLFVFAWWRRRKENRAAMARLEHEEALEALAQIDPGTPLLKHQSAPPTVEHGGESHTLH